MVRTKEEDEGRTTDHPIPWNSELGAVIHQWAAAIMERGVPYVSTEYF